jgi:poly(hydroxyalkanoate) granule-associated protein
MARKNGKKTNAIPMIKDRAQQIWLAGLGAFAMAGEEGGRLFKNLVKKGEVMEKHNKQRLEQVLTKAEKVQERVQGDARHALTRITRPFEDGVDNAMHRLGVPTRKEIQMLTKRVEELTRVVQKGKGRGARKARRPVAAVAAE